MKKKLLAIILMLAMAAALIPAFSAQAVYAADIVDEFPDATGDSVNKTAYNSIYWAVGQGIINGFSDGTFGPDESCTRAQFVVMVWRLSGKPEPASTSSAGRFSDVNGLSGGMLKAISWAVEKGIISGFNDGTFRPDDTVTRRQSAVMLWRMAGKPAATATTSFSDISSGETTYPAIQWGASVGLIKGFSDGTFGPEQNCLRQQIVIFLYRYADNVEGKEMVIPEIKKADGSTAPAEEPTPAQPAVPDNGGGSSDSNSDYVMKKVDINNDNWQDYLEIVTVKLSRGEGAYHYSYRLKLKDEYALNYKEHSGYNISKDMAEAAINDSSILQVLIAEGEISLPDTGSVTAAYTVFCPHMEELLIPYNPGALIIYGGPDLKTVSITEVSYGRYLINDMMDDERSKELAHCWETMEYVGTLHTEDESVFTDSYVVEITDVGGTIYVWEKK